MQVVGHSMIDADAIAAARAVRIEDEIGRRGVQLRRRGTDRFWINVRKQIWGCRGCYPKASDVIGLVMHLDGCAFVDAIRTLTGIADLDRRPSAPDPAKQAEAQAKAEAQARDELADVRQRMAKASAI
jgi:DNA primase